MWEMYYTDLDVGHKVRAARIKSVQRQVDATSRFSPAFEVMHPLQATQPEESLVILPHSVFHLIRAMMPDYRAWLNQRDLLDDYRYLKEALQVLQHGRDRKRWILKFPSHLNHLDVIYKVFPDAKIVWTHRDPVTVMGSICSLVETMMGLHLKQLDLDAIGQLCLELLVESIDRGRHFRAELPRGSIIDVPYHQVASDPDNGVPKLYEQLGAEWTDVDAFNLTNVLARPMNDRKHEYDLRRYGLNQLDVQDAFGDYVQLVEGFNSSVPRR